MLKESINFDTQYADDCGYAVVTQNTNAIHYIKIITPQILKSRHFLCNEEKTEHHVVSRKNNDYSWKKCKYLGSKLSTDDDIIHRTPLTNNTMNNLNEVWKSNLPINTKMIIFNGFIQSVFMYNTCLWIVKKRIHNNMNSIHTK
ncbi:hypothetical protein A3Q56_07163 [Intoshia linei]|uniref:Reverse transcriptase domain-containing protein n=1 Tax=Intoshia linei TaxID=1819745 RepID=A0A177AUR0_9BILA|nr:hypothetical protein A3Q56_07163 [Intoshia linei]